jgi:hypothetical protein
MRQVGIDVRHAVPRALTPQLAADARRLLTIGCGEALPLRAGLEA